MSMESQIAAMKYLAKVKPKKFRLKFFRGASLVSLILEEFISFDYPLCGEVHMWEDFWEVHINK